MTPVEAIGQYRIKTQDLGDPPLWTDAEILEYLDDAQVEACRRAHLLIDSTGDASEGAVSASDPMVALDEKVISVRRVRLQSNSIPLRRMSVRDMDEQFPGWEAQTQPSTPCIYIPDYETGYLRLYPTPLINDTLKMTAVRVSTTLRDRDSKFEIASRYHRGLLDWAMYRGYSKPDPETQDEKKAKSHEAAFIAEFGERSTAVDERWAFEQYQDIGET